MEMFSGGGDVQLVVRAADDGDRPLHGHHPPPVLTHLDQLQD